MQENGIRKDSLSIGSDPLTNDSYHATNESLNTNDILTPQLRIALEVNITKKLLKIQFYDWI